MSWSPEPAPEPSPPSKPKVYANVHTWHLHVRGNLFVDGEWLRIVERGVDGGGHFYILAPLTTTDES